MRRFQKIRESYRCHRRHRQNRVVPTGCFTVCVGPEKQRFVIKIEHANHPRFLALLEEADDNEYGSPIHYHGPIHLPCNVHVFRQALTEMDKPHSDGHPSFRIVPRRLMSLIQRLVTL